MKWIAWAMAWGIAAWVSPGVRAQTLAESLHAVGAMAYYVEGKTALGSSANRNFISNAGFVIGPTGVVVVDALGSPVLAQELHALIRSKTKLPVVAVIATHYHADHIYGLQYFREQGIPIIAQRRALEYLSSDTARLRLEASRQDLAPWVDDQTRLITADTLLDGPNVMTLGGLKVDIRVVGPAHTPEDLIVWFPQAQTLFSGDLLFRGRLPFVGQANSSQWIKALDAMADMGARWIIPGHGGATSEATKDVNLLRRYLSYLRQTMGAAAKDLTPFEQAYADTDWTEFQALPMFAFANRMNAYNTYLLMEHEISEEEAKGSQAPAAPR